jgi:hypothetical protein
MAACMAGAYAEYQGYHISNPVSYTGSRRLVGVEGRPTQRHP